MREIRTLCRQEASERAIGADADKDASSSNLGGVVGHRPILEGGERRFDFAEPRVHFVGQLLCGFVFGFEVGLLRLQRLDRRLFLRREACPMPAPPISASFCRMSISSRRPPRALRSSLMRRWSDRRRPAPWPHGRNGAALPPPFTNACSMDPSGGSRTSPQSRCAVSTTVSDGRRSTRSASTSSLKPGSDQQF